MSVARVPARAPPALHEQRVAGAVVRQPAEHRRVLRRVVEAGLVGRRRSSAGRPRRDRGGARASAGARRARRAPRCESPARRARRPRRAPTRAPAAAGRSSPCSDRRTAPRVAYSGARRQPAGASQKAVCGRNPSGAPRAQDGPQLGAGARGVDEAPRDRVKARVPVPHVAVARRRRARERVRHAVAAHALAPVAAQHLLGAAAQRGAPARARGGVRPPPPHSAPPALSGSPRPRGAGGRGARAAPSRPRTRRPRSSARRAPPPRRGRARAARAASIAASSPSTSPGSYVRASPPMCAADGAVAHVTTHAPLAAASKPTRPKVSCAPGMTTTRAAAYARASSARSAMYGRHCTRAPRPRFSASRRRRSSIGPRPMQAQAPRLARARGRVQELDDALLAPEPAGVEDVVLARHGGLRHERRIQAEAQRRSPRRGRSPRGCRPPT